MIRSRKLRQDFGAVLLVGNAVDGILEGAIVIVRAHPRFEGPLRPVIRYVAENGLLPSTLNYVRILNSIRSRIGEVRRIRGAAGERNGVRENARFIGLREHTDQPIQGAV